MKKNNISSEIIFYDNFNSAIDVVLDAASRYSDLNAITDTYNNVEMTYAQLKADVDYFATGLQALGVKKGDRVGLFAESNGLWPVSSFAISKCGGIDVLRGSNAPIDELKYIIIHSECKGLILKDIKLFNSLKPFLTTRNLDFIIITYADKNINTEGLKTKVYTHADIINLGKENTFTPVSITRDDPMSMLYTSGTTGNPKGVVLTQGNMIHQLEIATNGTQASPGENTLQILPVWHAYERIAEFLFLSRGCHLYYTTLSGLKNDLAKYNINALMSVPRIWEAIKNGIYQKLKQTSPIAYAIFNFAIKTSIKYKIHKMYGERRITNKANYHTISTIVHKIKRSFYKPLHVLFYKTLYKKVKQAAGLDSLRYSISGGGALSMQDELFYDAIGVDLRIGYGLTETSPVLTLRNVWDKNFLGAAGKPVAATDLKIVDCKTHKELPRFAKGLVVVKGPQVMKGYYKDEKATEQAFTPDGYFITGDLGWLTNDNNLVLVGRLKETIVLSTGENVEPIPIEEAILASPYIEQIVLVGQDKSGVGALVVPSREALEKCGINMKDIPSSKEGGFNNPELELLIKNEINTNIQNKANLRMFEKVKQFALIKESFSIENGMLSMTQKIKRNKVFEKYKELIGSMYNNK